MYKKIFRNINRSLDNDRNMVISIISTTLATVALFTGFTIYAITDIKSAKAEHIELNYNEFNVLNTYGEHAELYDEKTGDRITIERLEQYDRLPVSNVSYTGRVLTDKLFILDDGRQYKIVDSYSQDDI